MQFEVGDAVVHPVHGVGQIVKIEEKHFSEKGIHLSYQITLLPKHTIWIPVERYESTRLRRVTVKSDLGQYRNLLKSRPVPLPKNHHQRTPPGAPQPFETRLLPDNV